LKIKRNGDRPNARARKALPSPKAGLMSGAATFVIALAVALPMQKILSGVGPLWAFPLAFAVVALGVLADVIGVAAASADEAPFHAMAAKRIPGAKQSIILIRNADRVSSVMNDMIGDLAGTLSGALIGGAVLGVSDPRFLDPALAGTISVGLVAAFTVGGKAAAKGIAINRANEVMTTAGRVLEFWERVTGLRLSEVSRGQGRRGKTK